MTSQSQSVHLLILTSRADEAADLVTTLRTGGIPARGVYTHQSERLVELTSAEPVELILCCANDPEIDVSGVLGYYRELTEDIPLVILTDDATDPQDFLGALREGARDLVPRSEIERLQLMVARELADRQARSKLQQMELQLQLCEQRALELVESTDQAIALVREGVHIHANTAYQRKLGFAAIEELEGLPLLDVVVAEDQKPLRELLRREDELGLSEEATKLRVSCLHLDGTSFPAELLFSQAELDGVPCVRVAVRDGTATATDPSAILVDPDTGLANRAALFTELSARLTRNLDASPIPLALLYVGINSFPDILRAAGSKQAFEIAAGLGTALRQLVPEGSFLARFADDGFIILADGLDPAEAKNLIIAIKREIRLPIALPNRDTAQPDSVTGLAFCDGGDYTPGGLIDQAYADAFAASGTAGELPPIPEAAPPPPREPPADTAPARTDAADREIAEKIDEALRTDGFKLVYQPIISLLGDNQENYSVLVRLLDDQQRLHEARELIGPAVRTGRVEAIDRWVLRQAIKEVAEQRNNGQKINFFVNLAEHTFLETTLLLWVCDRLREYEARGNWLTFQFQEIHARQHLARLTKVVDGLKKIKARIALSRFGHDPQPDALLQTLQADFVLFAPDFAQHLSEDDDKQQRLMELANHAREFNVKTVVTGVEDATTLTVLWGAGIDYVQGNFLQRPSAVLTVEQE